MTETVRRPARSVIRTRAVAAGGATVLGGAALAYVAARNPHDPSVVMPRCPFHWATGLQCPGCGGLRMVHDLLHGHLGAAFADNAVLLLLAPVLIALLVRGAWRWTHGRPATGGGRFEVNGRPGLLLVVTAVAWTVLRNVAGG